MGSETSKQRPPVNDKPISPRSCSKKLVRSSRRFSMGTMSPPTVKLSNVQIKMGPSASCDMEQLPSPALNERLSSRQHSDSGLSVNQNSRSRSGSTISTNGGQHKTSTINLRNRQLVQGCFQSQFAESIGQRILKRAAERRKDFGRFYISISTAQRDELADLVKNMLKKCVACIDKSDELQRVSTEEGEKFVKFRTQGFKADYFAALADSTITECVFLDNAVHPAHQTLSAFSQLIAMLFSSVRDGFYNEMRRIRRSSNSFSSSSAGGRKKESVEEVVLRSRETSPRSLSPADEYSSARKDSEERQMKMKERTHSFAGFTNEEPIIDCRMVEKENNWPLGGHHNGMIIIDNNGLLMPPPQI